MKKKRVEVRRRSLAYTIVCDWCAERKEVSRSDAKTCSTRCRGRLHRLIKMCGFGPDHPPGPRTVMDVFNELVLILLRRERARRRLAADAKRGQAQIDGTA